MVDDCLLNYTSIPDIGTTLYKNDWNFFKKKSHAKSTYEEILEMLYPPSVKEQLKPSPIRIIQTFGALLYVLDLHNTHPLITQQTLSIVFYWLGCTLFNRIVSQKKYMSRAKAIQLRLNISVVEDWARSNDREPKINCKTASRIQQTCQEGGYPGENITASGGVEQRSIG